MTSSVGAAATADTGRGISVSEDSTDYKIILPPLPTGYIVTNAVFLHCDVRNRPYRIQDFKQELERLDVLQELASAGAHQMNHVWMLRLHSLAAKQRLVEAKELQIKGGHCLVLDPANAEVKAKLHWVPYDVPNCQVRKELERFAKVSDISRDHFREKGFENVETNTRSVRMTLKEGVTVDGVPHEIRVDGCKVLVLIPGRAPLCLRCRRKGHIRRDCRVPRCKECHQYGHEASDCVRTYASIAQQRKDEESTEFLMDEVEAEAATGGAGPPLPSANDSGRDASIGNQDNFGESSQPSQSEQAKQATGNKEQEVNLSPKPRHADEKVGMNTLKDKDTLDSESEVAEPMNIDVSQTGKRQRDQTLHKASPNDTVGGEPP